MKQMTIKELKINKFSLNLMNSNDTVAVFGKRMAGKSTLFKDILHQFPDLKSHSTVVDPTSAIQHKYDDVVSKDKIFSVYDEDIVNDIIQKQKLNTIEAALVLDNCMFDNNWHKSEAMKDIFYNGKCLRTMLLLGLSYPMGLPFGFRSNLDWVFIFRDPIATNQRRYYEYFGDGCPSLATFCSIMNKCTNDYSCLVIHNTCNAADWTSRVFWYQANLHPQSEKQISTHRSMNPPDFERAFHDDLHNEIVKHTQIIKFYRISDSFQQTVGNVGKSRPSWFTKKNCFKNFVNAFGTANLYIIADKIGLETFNFLKDYVPVQQIVQTKYGSGAFSFMHAARMAAQFPDSTKIFFVEDDYLFTKDCEACVIEALEIADYVTPYDANDKYVNAGTVDNHGCVGNPLISDSSEMTRLYVTKSCHHKLTNSTTMTFATSAKLVKQDLPIYEIFCKTGYPEDFAMWRDLLTNRKRTLLSNVPAKATHCESNYLAPLISWTDINSQTCDSRC